MMEAAPASPFEIARDALFRRPRPRRHRKRRLAMREQRRHRLDRADQALDLIRREDVFPPRHAAGRQSVRDRCVEQIWLRLTTGLAPGPMPSYAETLDASRRWDVANYIVASQRVAPWEPGGRQVALRRHRLPRVPRRRPARRQGPRRCEGLSGRVTRSDRALDVPRGVRALQVQVDPGRSAAERRRPVVWQRPHISAWTR